MYKQGGKGYIKILGGEGMFTGRGWINTLYKEKSLYIYSEGRVILINREEMVN